MTDYPVTFPAPSIPSKPNAARLLGLYPQRQEGLWMQRVRVPGGRLTPAQWQALAEIARTLTPGEPLHLTTRQDLEIHGLTERTVPEAQRALADVDLTGFGGCGDTIRNVTVCPCSGIAPGAPDLLPLAGHLTELMQSQPGAFAMPRKFKVSLSACGDACGLPWINDVGLVAQPSGGAWSFRATVAGSLGQSPGLGIAWPGSLQTGEVPALVLAALRVFATHGDRENRRRARLRHVRERLGDEAFCRLLSNEFDRTRAQFESADVAVRAPQPALARRRQVAVTQGNIPPEAAETFGALADREDVKVRIGLRHEVWLFAADVNALDEAVARLPKEWRGGPTVVACPGARWCPHGLVDSQAMARRLRDALATTATDTWIAVSGCPNGCAHSAVADIGLTGRLVRAGARRREGYRVMAGGNAAREPRLATVLQEKALTEQVHDIIRARLPKRRRPA